MRSIRTPRQMWHDRAIAYEEHARLTDEDSKRAYWYAAARRAWQQYALATMTVSRTPARAGAA